MRENLRPAGLSTISTVKTGAGNGGHTVLMMMRMRPSPCCNLASVLQRSHPFQVLLQAPVRLARTRHFGASHCEGVGGHVMACYLPHCGGEGEDMAWHVIFPKLDILWWCGVHLGNIMVLGRVKGEKGGKL